MEIIKKNIVNLQDKVEILQIYGPKLLRESDKQKQQYKGGSYYTSANIKKSSDVTTLDTEVVGILQDVVKALIDYTTHNKTFSLKQFKGFELRKNQRVRIEDLL